MPTTLTPHPPALATVEDIFRAQRAKAPALAKTTARERIAKLRRLQEALLDRKQAFRDAMMADFKKHPTEVDMTEILPVTSEIKHVASHLADWMEPDSVGTPLSLIGSRSEIRTEPRGVCLIISPWNFPVNLSLIPLVSAVAAGNTVVLKPSEYAPHTASALAKLIAAVFDPSEVTVVEGDVETARALLAQPFDHVFFTGSPAVGKIVMRAAAEHLSSITLELGGKSPAIVDESADPVEAARKIAWGKCINNGQTCIAPDYVLVHESHYDAFIDALDAQWTVQYGATDEARRQSASLARIVNDKHFQRVHDLLQDALEQGAEARIGGSINEADRYVAPTVLTGVTEGMRVLEEEIFGPLLPVLPYHDREEALAFIQDRPKPLAMYVFSKRRRNTEYWLSQTSSGGVTVNDTIVHFFNPNMPFGGVNNSGIGQSHGHFGFLTFSHQRGVLHQQTRLSATKLLYPPYNDQVDTLVDWSIKLL